MLPYLSHTDFTYRFYLISPDVVDSSAATFTLKFTKGSMFFVDWLSFLTPFRSFGLLLHHPVIFQPLAKIWTDNWRPILLLCIRHWLMLVTVSDNDNFGTTSRSHLKLARPYSAALGLDKEQVRACLIQSYRPRESGGYSVREQFPFPYFLTLVVTGQSRKKDCVNWYVCLSRRPLRTGKLFSYPEFINITKA